MASVNYEQGATWPVPTTPENDRLSPPMSPPNNYSSDSSAGPISIPVRRKSKSAKKRTARSHYSTRSEEVGVDEQPEYTASAAEVRQQTLSWTYRELNQPTFNSNVSGSGLKYRSYISTASETNPRPMRVMSHESLHKLPQNRTHLSGKQPVSQLSALRQLALSIERQENESSESSDPEQPTIQYTTQTPPHLQSPLTQAYFPRSSTPEPEVEYGSSPPLEFVYQMNGEEETPLLPSHANHRAYDGSIHPTSKRTSFAKSTFSALHFKHIKDFRPRDVLTWTGLVAKCIPAVILGLILNLLDAMSYGTIVFPAGDPHIPDTAQQAGISMFFASTVIAQLVYSLGGSGFKGVNGSMMIEVMPFLHIICNIIERQMAGQDDKAILATIMVAIAMSTILTGIVFLLLGVFKLGNIIQFFPRHILVGCIGGIGLFLVYTGVEVTSGIVTEATNPSYYLSIFQPTALKLWVTALSIAVLLKMLQKKISHPLFVPLFYVFVPAVFYAVVLGMGVSIEKLREDRWLFQVPGGKQAPFYEFWGWFDMKGVDWGAIPATIPTQLALTFFGILHVPINVPALAVSTAQEVDVNRELIGHGISNLASGFIGSCQNYLVYSNSVLYIRSGGDSRLGGILLAIATAALWMVGGSVIGFVPTVVVGALIFHLGIDLMKESIVDTWKIGMHPLEYLTILMIVAIMGIFGFTEGIISGIILACVFFVVMYSRRSVIRASFTGSQLRSTVHRLYRQQMFLDQVGDQIHIVKLQGFIFFGTINQLDDYLRITLLDRPKTRFVVLDFSLISGIDYSALETFLRIKRTMRDSSTHLVFCGLSGVGRELLKSGIFHDDDEDVEGNMRRNVHTFGNMNEALEWCENRLLATYYRTKTERSTGVEIPARERTISGTSTSKGNSFEVPPSYLCQPFTPRQVEVNNAASLILRENPETHDIPTHQFHPVSILMQAFSEVSAEHAAELADFCEDRFERVEVAKGETLWDNGDEASELYVVEHGELVLIIPDQNDMKVVETLLPGTMVGELEMFSDRPRTCRLVASANSVIWRLSKTSFEAMTEEDPKLMLKFVKVAVSFDAVRFYNTVYHWAQLK